jgi:hypothetical protein
MVSDETIMLATEALEGHLMCVVTFKKFKGTYKVMVDGLIRLWMELLKR